MCGIVGIISQYTTAGFTSTEVNAFHQLMLVNTTRGMDSTGVFGVHKDGKVDFMKATGPVWEFDTWKKADQFYSRMLNQYVAVFAHARAATIGAVTAKNAHPFVHPPITMIHNGTLRNFRKICEDKKIEVDSEYCAILIKEKGIQETINTIDGAYCFVWHDATDNKIHILKNDERPLHWMQTNTALYFGSEKCFLEYARDKINIYTGKTEENQNGVVQPFPINKHYTFSPCTKTHDFEVMEPKKPWSSPSKKNSHGYSNVYSGINDWEGDEAVGEYAEYEGIWLPVTEIEKRKASKKPLLLTNKKDDRFYVVLGDYVQFGINSMHLSEGETPHWVIEGTMFDYPNVKVRYMGTDKFDVLSHEAEWGEGKLISIYRTPERDNKKTKLILFVENPRVFKSASELTQKKTVDLNEEVMIGGGVSMTRRRFRHLADQRCKNCMGSIDEDDADLCSLAIGAHSFSEGLLCPECATATHPLQEMGGV